jgi:hypothetical protein
MADEAVRIMARGSGRFIVEVERGPDATRLFNVRL